MILNWNRLSATCAAVAIALLVSGCSAMRAASVRQEYIRSQTQDYVYQRPIAEVWGTSRQLLFQRGYELQNTGEGGTYTAETRWKVDGTVQSRYLVQAIKLDEKSCKLNLSYVSGAVGQTYFSTGRDIDTEWLLLQQLEPDRAAAIATEADRRGEVARGG